MKEFSETNLIEVSQQLLLSVRTHAAVDSFVEIFRKVSVDLLAKQLVNDDFKKAFWINIYNGYTQIILSKTPLHHRNRNSFFSLSQIAIAGYKLSFDDIEHGILRHSKVKWSFGYLNKLFPSLFEKKRRVKTLDYRIHFALNCGAKSCPPIVFYKPEQLDKQLDEATRAYLENEAEYQEIENSVTLPAIMCWFYADFGGRKGITALLHRLQIVPEKQNPRIKFKKYNWTLFLENYKS